MVRRFCSENGLSLAFWLLFLASFIGQALLGHAAGEAGDGQSLIAFVTSSKFVEGIFVNWQAALLQLAALVLFAAVLRQRGSSHSRKSPAEHRAKGEPGVPVDDPRFPWAYRHSLSLALLAFTLAAFTAFVLADKALYTEQQLAAGRPAPGLLAFMASAKLWFDVLQTWQAEFFAMGLFLLLTIFLREEHSAESKPVDAADSDTGVTNN